MRSRIFVEKYKDAIDYGNQALKKFADSRVINDLLRKAKDEYKKEEVRIEEISTMKSV